MVAYVDGHKVGRLVPAGLARHVIIDGATINLEPLEGDVLHLALLVVAVDDGHIGLLATVADVAQRAAARARWYFSMIAASPRWT